jgi:adenylate kinase family enzyme
MDRVAIVGSPGSGKSTLARNLEGAVGVEHIELDALFHRPDWQTTPIPEFRAAVARALETDRWVVDGNYRPVQDLVMGSADTIVFVDLSRWRVTQRVVRRSLWRVIRRQQLWGTNHESLRRLVSRDPEENIIVWTWTQHPRYRAMYRTSMIDGSWEHARVVQLRSPRAVRRFRREAVV